MDCEKLIAVVEEHPVLYNTNHPDYMRTKLKDELWAKIGDEFFLEGPAVKDRWTKLRDNHREALRRQKIKSGQNVKFSRPWTYQKQMEFLLPFMKNRNATSNVDMLSVEITDEEPESPGMEDDLTNQDCDTDVNETEKNEEANGGQKKLKRKWNKGKEGTLSKSVPSSIQRFLGKCEQRAQIRDELRLKLLESKSAEVTKDAMHSFFNAMYMATKELPSVYQRQIRKQIFHVVSEAEESYEMQLDREFVAH